MEKIKAAIIKIPTKYIILGVLAGYYIIKGIIHWINNPEKEKIQKPQNIPFKTSLINGPFFESQEFKYLALTTVGFVLLIILKYINSKHELQLAREFENPDENESIMERLAKKKEAEEKINANLNENSEKSSKPKSEQDSQFGFFCQG